MSRRPSYTTASGGHRRTPSGSTHSSLHGTGGGGGGPRVTFGETTTLNEEPARVAEPRRNGGVSSSSGGSSRGGGGGTHGGYDTGYDPAYGGQPSNEYNGRRRGGHDGVGHSTSGYQNGSHREHGSPHYGGSGHNGSVPMNSSSSSARSPPQHTYQDQQLQTKIAEAFFYHADVDRSGTLDPHEFHNLLRDMGFDMNYDSALLMFKQADTRTSDGHISRSEFVDWYVRYVAEAPSPGSSPGSASGSSAGMAGPGSSISGTRAVPVNGSGSLRRESSNSSYGSSNGSGSGRGSRNNGSTSNGYTSGHSSSSRRHLDYGNTNPRDEYIHQRNIARAYFYAADRDRSGYLDPREFKTLLHELGAPVSTETAMQTFQSVDRSGNRRISLSEFTEFYLDLCRSKQQTYY